MKKFSLRFVTLAKILGTVGEKYVFLLLFSKFEYFLAKWANNSPIFLKYFHFENI